jgi:hypothetical protein
MTPEEMWEAECGWEGHELSQLRRCAAWPFHQKIAWLEQAQRLAQHLAGQVPGDRRNATAPTGAPNE